MPDGELEERHLGTPIAGRTRTEVEGLIGLSLSAAIAGDLTASARRHGATLFMTLLAAFDILTRDPRRSPRRAFGPGRGHRDRQRQNVHHPAGQFASVADTMAF